MLAVGALIAVVAILRQRQANRQALDEMTHEEEEDADAFDLRAVDAEIAAEEESWRGDQHLPNDDENESWR